MDDKTFYEVLNNIDDLNTLKRLYKYAEEYENNLQKEYEQLREQHDKIAQKLMDLRNDFSAPRTVMVHDRISKVVLEDTDD